MIIRSLTEYEKQILWRALFDLAACQTTVRPLREGAEVMIEQKMPANLLWVSERGEQ
jgi:hypothetical protein